MVEWQSPVVHGNQTWQIQTRKTKSIKYSVEVWIPNDAGTLRFITTWSEGNSFEFADSLIIGSVNDAFKARKVSGE